MDDYDDDNNTSLKLIFAREVVFSILPFLLLVLKSKLQSELLKIIKSPYVYLLFRMVLTFDFFDLNITACEL